MQTVVVQEPVIRVAEHYIVRIGFHQSGISRRRHTAMRFDYVIHRVRIISPFHSGQNAIITVIHHNHFDKVERNAPLHGDTVKQVFAQFPRFLVMWHDDV